MKNPALILLSAALLASCGRAPAPQPAQPIVVKRPSPTPAPFVSDLKIRPEWSGKLDRIAAGIARDKAQYLAIERLRAGGMPWFIVGGIHERESSRDFTKHLHEGSPLIHRTQYVPKGRLPAPHEPPYTFVQSAEDALYILKSEQRVDWHDVKKALDAIELYNGTGYRRFHPDVPSPYLYSGLTNYSRGKYVADGRFSASAIDQQAGVVAIWLRMQQRGLL